MYYINKGLNICYIIDYRNEMEDKDRERQREYMYNVRYNYRIICI